MKGLYIANTILEYFFDIDEYIRPMKLQKLLYYVAGFYYKETNTYYPDENFYKWDYGPVIQEVYKGFAHYKKDYIEDYYYQDEESKKKIYIVSSQNQEFYEIMNEVLDFYGDYDDIELSDMTHTHAAWQKPDLYDKIPKNLIKDTFNDMEIGDDA